MRYYVKETENYIECVSFHIFWETTTVLLCGQTSEIITNLPFTTGNGGH